MIFNLAVALGVGALIWGGIDGWRTGVERVKVCREHGHAWSPDSDRCGRCNKVRP